MADTALAPLESLLDQTEANEAQLWLTLGEAAGFSAGKVDRQGPKKRYTGELLFHRNPRIYKAILILGAEPGMSYRRISDIVHCTECTVKAVLAREPAAVTAHKKELLNTGRVVQRASLERLNELVPDMTAKDAALTFGIVTDKVELLSGGVTARVEVTDGAAVLRRFLDLHERIEKTVRGEVIESAPVIGSAGENPALNAPPDPGASDAAIEPITSDNVQNIKPKVIDAEPLSDGAIDAIVIREIETDVPEPADEARASGPGTGPGGVVESAPANLPHLYKQPEIL